MSQLKALGDAGRQAGVDFDATQAFFTNFITRLDQLRKGSGPLFDALLRINTGLITELAGAKDSAAAIDSLAKAYAGLTDQAQSWRWRGPLAAAAALAARRCCSNLRRPGRRLGGVKHQFRRRQCADRRAEKANRRAQGRSLRRVSAQPLRSKPCSAKRKAPKFAGRSRKRSSGSPPLTARCRRACQARRERPSARRPQHRVQITGNAKAPAETPGASFSEARFDSSAITQASAAMKVLGGPTAKAKRYARGEPGAGKAQCVSRRSATARRKPSN